MFMTYSQMDKKIYDQTIRLLDIADESLTYVAFLILATGRGSLPLCEYGKTTTTTKFSYIVLLQTILDVKISLKMIDMQLALQHTALGHKHPFL